MLNSLHCTYYISKWVQFLLCKKKKSLLFFDGQWVRFSCELCKTGNSTGLCSVFSLRWWDNLLWKFFSPWILFSDVSWLSSCFSCYCDGAWKGTMFKRGEKSIIYVSAMFVLFYGRLKTELTHLCFHQSSVLCFHFCIVPFPVETVSFRCHADVFCTLCAITTHNTWRKERERVCVCVCKCVYV